MSKEKVEIIISNKSKPHKFINVKPLSFRIDLDIYPYSIYVCFANPELIKQEILNHKYNMYPDEYIDGIIKNINEDNPSARTITMSNGNCIIYINKSFYSKSMVLNCITHEVLHVTHSVMDRIGLKLNFKSDEAFCYLNGFLNEKILEKYLWK